MVNSKIRQLLASNRGRGRFAIEAGGTDEATIYLYDMIVDSEADAEWYGGVSAEAFVKQLAQLEASTIHLRVNSPGGSVFGGRAMENALRQHKANVIAHVDGLAASAASFVIMGADKIEMAQGAFLMIHKAWNIVWGNADDMRQQADLLDQIDGSLAQTYATRTGISVDKITSMMAEETWIEAASAVEQGFADSVAESTRKSDGATNAWDLAAFNHPPAQKAAQPASPPQEPAAKPADRAALHRAALRRLVPA